MRAIFFIILLLSSLSVWSEPLKLSSWNLRWLGYENNYREDNDVRVLSRYARQLDPDVIALQEVGDDWWARQLYKAGYDFHVTQQPGVSRRIAVAVKKSADINIQASDFIPLDTGNLRHGLDVTLERNGNSLRLLVVHLQTGCIWTKLNQSKSNACKQLIKQMEPLRNWVAQREVDNIPFMVIGDFNRWLKFEMEQNYRDNEGVLASLNNAATQSSGQQLTLVNSTYAPQCWNGRANYFLSYMVANNQALTMIRNGSFSEQIYRETGYDRWSRKLSDHCPISIELNL